MSVKQISVVDVMPCLEQGIPVYIADFQVFKILTASTLSVSQLQNYISDEACLFFATGDKAASYIPIEEQLNDLREATIEIYELLLSATPMEE